MDAGDAAQWAVVGFILIGLIQTWRKNGRGQDRKYGALEQKMENVEDELKDDDHGLNALKQGINDMKTHCAGVSTSLSEKVKTHEKIIERLKEKKK